jgi:hypothetical protein
VEPCQTGLPLRGTLICPTGYRRNSSFGSKSSLCISSFAPGEEGAMMTRLEVGRVL